MIKQSTITRDCVDKPHTFYKSYKRLVGGLSLQSSPCRTSNDKGQTELFATPNSQSVRPRIPSWILSDGPDGIDGHV
eukprot:4731720-Amphidinium_carterae.1